MKTCFAVTLFWCSALICSAQSLPSNFQYKRETGQKTGVPMFSLSTNTDSVAYDAVEGNGFEALGVEAQPERGNYGLLFMNAKPRRNLLFGRSRICSMKIDGEIAVVKTLTAMAAKKVSRLFIEYMILQIDRGVYEKLVAANDVFIKCGKVSYNLDQDNMMLFNGSAPKSVAI